MKTYHVNEEGYYGNFGGAYVPEILYKTVEDLRKAYLPILESEAFRKEYHALLKDYVGRPSPLYHARRLSEKYGCKLYLKREDLNHTGAHKSIMPSDKSFWHGKWAKRASLPRPVPANTVWPLLRSVP